MNPPKPAAVRAALAGPNFEGLTVEESFAIGTDPRASFDILRDHIHAIAAEMRAESIAMQVNTHDPFVEPGTREAEITAAKRLAVFADKLEGKAKALDKRPQGKWKGRAMKLLKGLLCRLGVICAGHVGHQKDAQGVWWVGLRCVRCGKFCHPVKSKYQDAKEARK